MVLSGSGWVWVVLGGSGGSISLSPLISTGLMDYSGYLMYIYDKYPDIHDFSCFFMFFRHLESF